MEIGSLLVVVGGIAWTIAYIDIIRVGFRDRTYGMPAAVIPLNLSWEIFYAFDGLTSLNIQFWINVAWCLADIVIVTTFIMYGRSEIPIHISLFVFLAGSGLALAISFALQAAFVAEFGVFSASFFSAFLINVVISAQFITMLLSRRSIRGQSLTIAVSKWIGTLMFTVIYGYLQFSILTLVLGAVICLFDLVYITLVVWTIRDGGGVLKTIYKEHTVGITRDVD